MESIELSIFRVPLELPFKLKNIGTAWHEMIADFYNQILMHVRGNEMPEVIFNRIEKIDDKLLIEFTGGDETTNSMVDMLVAYTSRINEETGEIIN